MASLTPFDDDVFVEDEHWSRTKTLSSPTFDGDISFENGIFEAFSSQHSRTLNGRTGDSSSHGDGPHGDELGVSEISDEALSVLSEKKNADQGDTDLLSTDFGTLDDRQQLQHGEDRLANDFLQLVALDQLSSPGDDLGGETDETKRSAADKSYVPSSGCGSPGVNPGAPGKRKLASSMRGPSQMNTRSRTRLEDLGDDNFAPANSTQAEPVRPDGVEGSRRKKPTASQKRVAKKPFGSGATGLESEIVHNRPPTKFGASQAGGSKSESPGNLSSASSGHQPYTARKDAVNASSGGKAPGLSIYDVERSLEPGKPAPRKTTAKGRSKKRTAAAPAPTTTGQVQNTKKASSRKAQAPAGSKSQAKPQENKQRKPLRTYGRAAAEEMVDGSSPGLSAIPNSKRRRSYVGQETTDRPLKQPKADNDTKASPVQDKGVSLTPEKVNIISSDDVDDEDGVAEHEGTLNLQLNPDPSRAQHHALNPIELGMRTQDESNQSLTTNSATQGGSAEDRPSKTAATSGQKHNDASRSTTEFEDKRVPLRLQVVSHLPKSRHHSSIGIDPRTTASTGECFPRIGKGIRDLDRSNRFAPLFSGENKRCHEGLQSSTPVQRDNQPQSSPYSLHPRSTAFHQNLSSIQPAQEMKQPGPEETNRIQPQSAKPPKPARTEVQDAPLKGKSRWQAAVDETSQGLADIMHSITNTVLRELTSKEVSVDSIVKEYSRNGAMVAANSFQRQQKEREKAVTQFQPQCADISQAFGCATEDSTGMKTELSSKTGWLRQLVTKRRRDHRDVMAASSANSATRDVV